MNLVSLFALKTILWILLVVPWITLLMMKKEHIKRYMPVAIFGSLLVTIWNELAYNLHWWKFTTTLAPSLITNIAFIYGTFLVGTIWIFRFTFGNFGLYLLTNIAIDSFLAFPANYVFERIGLYRLINYSSWNILITAVALSIVFYLYQLWQEEVFVHRNERGDDNHSETDFRNWFRNRAKAR